MNGDAAGTGEVIDVEEYSGAGRAMPAHTKGMTYRVRIDKTRHVMPGPQATGAELLAAAGKTPERYRLDQKVRGGQTKKIESHDIVDLRQPGLEKFMTLPLDQTEGEVLERAPVDVRRGFDLPEEDEEFLEAKEYAWETVILVEGGARALWLFIHEYPVPTGYVTAGTSVLRPTTLGIRVTGYPGGGLDMAYFAPALAREDGRTIPAVSALALDGAQFQQWSRHYTQANPFRVGVDSLATHLGVVDEWLLRELRR